MTLEDGNRASSQLAARGDVPLVQPELGGDETHAGPPFDGLFTGGMCLLDDPGEDRLGRLQLAALDQRRGELDPYLSPCGIVLRDQARRALEQLDRRARVAAPGSALPGRAQTGSGAGGKLCALLDEPELGGVATGLLEVVAEDLVELDQIGAALGEPFCEAAVEPTLVAFGSAS